MGWSSLAALALVLAVALLPPAVDAQQGRSVDWQRYDADLQVQSDGSVVVTETQAIAFHGTYRQGFRAIPLDRVTDITDVEVAEVVGDRMVPYTRAEPRRVPRHAREQ